MSVPLCVVGIHALAITALATGSFAVCAHLAVVLFRVWYRLELQQERLNDALAEASAEPARGLSSEARRQAELRWIAGVAREIRGTNRAEPEVFRFADVPASTETGLEQEGNAP